MSNRKGRLICFVGIDGSGKTTQARETAHWLRGQNIAVRYVWGFSRLWLTSSLIKIGKVFFFRNRNIYKDYPAYDVSKKKLFQHPILCRSYEALYLAEYACSTLFRVWLPRRLGLTVVCDRYVFDTVVSLATDLSYSEEGMKALLRKLLRLLPAPDAVFFIDLPERAAYERKTDVPSLEFLTEKRKLYSTLLGEYDVDTIDGLAPAEAIQAAVREKLGRLIPIPPPDRRRDGAVTPVAGRNGQCGSC